VHSVKALLDSGATGSFIDKDFVRMKGISTQSISHPILVYNVDGSPNKAGQISKVVDIVLYYKTHSERTCYESPKKEVISCTFKHLIHNIKIHNGVKI